MDDEFLRRHADFGLVVCMVLWLFVVAMMVINTEPLTPAEPEITIQE